MFIAPFRRFPEPAFHNPSPLRETQPDLESAPLLRRGAASTTSSLLPISHADLAPKRRVFGVGSVSPKDVGLAVGTAALGAGAFALTRVKDAPLWSCVILLAGGATLFGCTLQSAWSKHTQLRDALGVAQQALLDAKRLVHAPNVARPDSPLFDTVCFDDTERDQLEAERAQLQSETAQFVAERDALARSAHALEAAQQTFDAKLATNKLRIEAQVTHLAHLQASAERAERGASVRERVLDQKRQAAESLLLQARATRKQADDRLSDVHLEARIIRDKAKRCASRARVEAAAGQQEVQRILEEARAQAAAIVANARQPVSEGATSLV